MAEKISFRLPRATSSEHTLSRLGVTGLRWDDSAGVYVGTCSMAAINAIGQQGKDVLPDGCWEVFGKQAHLYPCKVSQTTLRKFARAIACTDGNAFIGSSLGRANSIESQYMTEARHAAMMLEGLGLDADAFASMFPDPMGCFSRLLPIPDRAASADLDGK